MCHQETSVLLVPDAGVGDYLVWYTELSGNVVAASDPVSVLATVTAKSQLDYSSFQSIRQHSFLGFLDFVLFVGFVV